MCVSKSMQDNHHAPLWDPGRLSCIAGTVAELLSHPLPLVHPTPSGTEPENEDADLSDVPPNPHQRKTRNLELPFLGVCIRSESYLSCMSSNVKTIEEEDDGDDNFSSAIRL